MSAALQLLTSSIFTVERYASKEEWLAARQLGLGASEVAAAIGLSPYESRYALWCRKVGILPPVAETRAMRRGNVMEPFIADEVARETGWQLVDHGRWTIFRSKRWPWLSVSLDRQILAFDERGDGALELKSANDRDAWTNGSVPEHHRVQLMTALAALGWNWGALSGYVSGTDEIVTVPMGRNDDLIEMIADVSQEMFAMIEDGRAAIARGEEPQHFPDPDSSESTAEALRARYRKEIAQDEAPQLAGEELEALEEQLVEHRRVRLAAEKELEAAKTTLMAIVGDRPEVRLPGGTLVTWKTQERAAVITPAKSIRVLNFYPPKPQKECR